MPHKGFSSFEPHQCRVSAASSPKTDRHNIDTRTSTCRNIGTSYCYPRLTPLQSLPPQLNTHQTDIRKGRIPESVLSKNTASPSLSPGVPSLWVLSVDCVPSVAQPQAGVHVPPTCPAIRCSSAANVSIPAIPARLCWQRLSRQLAGDVRQPTRTVPEQPEQCKNGTSSC